MLMSSELLSFLFPCSFCISCKWFFSPGGWGGLCWRKTVDRLEHSRKSEKLELLRTGR